MPNQIKSAVAIAILLVIAFVLYDGFSVVQPGTVGVATRFGAVQDGILPPGLHFKVPIMTKVIPVDTRVQKVEDEATASSKDLQVVTSKVALNYKIDDAKANIIYSELGPQYPRTIVEPAIQESIKSTTSKYTAEQLITQRATVKDDVFADLKTRLARTNIIATEFSIIDFNFSAEFNRAIEDKQVAEQAALRARNDLERIKTEAQQEIEKANGVAQAALTRAKAEQEAQSLLRQTLTPEILQLRAIEQWDGKLPVYNGSEAPLPFLSSPKTNQQ